MVSHCPVGEFNRPSGVAVDKDGDIYVADWLNNRVQVLTPEGRFIDVKREPGEGKSPECEAEIREPERAGTKRCCGGGTVFFGIVLLFCPPLSQAAFPIDLQAAFLRIVPVEGPPNQQEGEIRDAQPLPGAAPAEAEIRNHPGEETRGSGEGSRHKDTADA